MGYILDLYSARIDEIELRDSALFTLCQFAQSKNLSTYQVCKNLKSTRYEADYKNVYKKIKRFLNYRLVKKTDTLVNKHNSQFYCLTTTGIFTIMYHLRGKWSMFKSEIPDILKVLLTNYDNSEFFDFFVYPFFAKNTIMNIQSNIITEFFINYCTECARKSISKLYEKRLVDERGKFASKDTTQSLISDIKDQINNDPAADNDLPTGEQKLYLKHINDKVLFELEYERLLILENTMIFPLISQGKYKALDIPGIEHSPWYKRNWTAIEKDLILLLKDNNFHNILESTKSSFDKCYKGIIESRSS